jgi:hypothetical protein
LKKGYKFIERKKRLLFLSLKTNNNLSCSSPPLAKKLSSKPPLHVTPLDYLSEKRVKD